MTLHKISLRFGGVIVRKLPRAGGDRPVRILGCHQSRGRAGARRRSESRRLGGTSLQRSGARQGPEFFAIDHFHAGAHLLVPDPVAYRGRAVQPQDVGRARSHHRQGPGVDRRRVGNPRAHDHLDGRPSASRQECSARSDRLHHRRVERQRADRHHHAYQDRIHSPQRRGRAATRPPSPRISCGTETC